LTQCKVSIRQQRRAVYLLLRINGRLCGWSDKPGSSIIRGYDSSPLFREDCLIHIQHLQAEVDADLKQMEQGKKELAAIEERIKNLKRERDTELV